MTARPIIMHATSVRGLLVERKTMTRRIIKPQPIPFRLDDGLECEVGVLHVEGDRLPRVTLGRVITRQELPYAVGDRLWVREQWRAPKRWDDTKPRDLPARSMSIRFEAGGWIANVDHPGDWRPHDDAPGPTPDWVGKLRGALFLPRWASRWTLTVTNVHVERLQDISEADAFAEGIQVSLLAYGVNHANVSGKTVYDDSAYRLYSRLWDSLHGAGAWALNPFVAVIGFEVERRNIDEATP